MHTILLCGGSGQRLWPLSNPIRSKIFLELLPSPNEGMESMLERLCRQLDTKGLGSSALFLTHQDQVGLTRRYTKDCYPIVGEPHKRGTFTAAALAAVYLHSVEKVHLEDILCVAPADMYADDHFFDLFHTLPNLLKHSQADIALLGTRPTHPSDQYGYILPGTNASTEYASVIRFEEKPDLLRAQELIHNNALWNCGVFAFSLRFMLSYLEQMGLPTDYNEFIDLYPNLPIRSFDKEVVEQTKNTIVIPHEGEWHDLGSWESLTKQLQANVIGEGVIWGESNNTHIVNELNSPLYVINVSDIVAVASPDGILVAKKNQANMIKEILGLGGSSKYPMFGENVWGCYSVLDQSVSEIDAVITLKWTLLPGHDTSELYSQYYSKVWTILSGNGEVTLNGLVQKAQVGDVFTIKIGVKHKIRAFSDMEYLEVRIGEHLFEEEIFKI